MTRMHIHDRMLFVFGIVLSLSEPFGASIVPDPQIAKRSSGSSTGVTVPSQVNMDILIVPRLGLGLHQAYNIVKCCSTSSNAQHLQHLPRVLTLRIGDRFCRRALGTESCLMFSTQSMCPGFRCFAGQPPTGGSSRKTRLCDLDNCPVHVKGSIPCVFSRATIRIPIYADFGFASGTMREPSS
jgi:hypothetical protein